MRRIGGRSVRQRGGRLTLLLVLGSAACGGSSNPGPGPGPTPLPPTLSCPANREVSAVQGQPPPVTYDVPTAENGQPPVTVTCAPASGSTFPLGATAVTCTATDALARTATCGFTLTVVVPPKLSVTKFVAFGDSLTEGVISAAPTLLLLNTPDSYPSKLQPLLSARYTDQAIEVVNEGCAGEFVDSSSMNCAGGVKRLPDVLDTHRPNVLLLMHGANDLRRDADAGIPHVIGSLETMIGEAQRRGIVVMVATLPPQNPAGSRGDGADELPFLNREIVKMAADEGATLVDLFGALGTWQGYIGVDGLHPTPAGYEKIAQVWFEAIKAKFEGGT